MVPDNIKSRCPKCSSSVAFPTYLSATIVVTRTCRKCACRWLIKVIPLETKLEGALTHKLEWLDVSVARLES